MTFVFTDVEGSTALRERFPEAMATAMARHNRLVREALESRGGYVFKFVGDGACAAFDRARDALAAAAETQRRMHAEDWQAIRPDLPPLKIRVGIYTGSARTKDGDYEGRTLNRVARLMAAGHGGQTLLNLATQQLAHADLPPGVSIRDRGIHWLKDLLHAEHIFELACRDLPPCREALATARPLETGDRVAVDLTVPGHVHPSTLGELMAVLRDSDDPVDLTTELVRAVVRHTPATLAEYRAQRIVAWSMPRHRLDRRFVHLTLLVDQGEESLQGRWREESKEYSDMGRLMEESLDPVLVVLGAPGSGKTTILRRLELDLALAGLRAPDLGRDTSPVTFFVELSGYRPVAADRLPDPREWVAELWASRYPNLPPLERFLEEGRAVILLDGLNEMPVSGSVARRALEGWKACLQDLGRGVPGNRAVLSCRTLDYSASLSTATLRVPQIRLDPLTSDQVRTFVKLYAPGRWRPLWNSLKGRDLDAFRTPFALRLLVDQEAEAGETPAGSAALFTGFVRNALRREMEAGNPLFQPSGLLSHSDCRKLTQGRWRGPTELPKGGALVPKLASLAYAMQQNHGAGERSQVCLSHGEAVERLAGHTAEDVLRAGFDMGVLDADLEDEVRFCHSLHQEHFAARCFAAHPDPALAAAPWRGADMEPALDEVLAGLAAAEPLPALPATGWEETVRLAAEISAEPASLIEDLKEVNLVLAAECAVQGTVRPRLPRALKDELRAALVHRATDTESDLRSRIEAALVLGRLGDPRFKVRRGSQGQFLDAPLVAVAAGRYPIGDDEGPFPEEAPAHTVELKGLELGRYPVTNAEYSLFIAANGYDDPRWWDTQAGRRWREGVGTSEGGKYNVRIQLEEVRSHPEVLDRFLAAGTLTAEHHALWLARLAMEPAKLEAHLADAFPAGRRTAPRFWDEATFNSPIQPVVGVSWFEARAYCRWLSAQTGRDHRLPSEAEMEAATRGKEGRRFAYGNRFDATRGNCVETHLRQPSPVGAFPGGNTPDGLADVTGNVFEWTSSAYARAPYEPLYPYPYDPEDGREEADTDLDVLRVCRGGSWAYDEEYARATLRFTTSPASRVSACGFRVACDTVE